MSAHGRFRWYELMTADLAGAEAFYGTLLDWTAADAGMPGIDYRLFSRGGTPVAGLMGLMAGGPGPGWLGYVAVDDADAVVDRAGRAGATVHRPPQDIPGVGRFAIFSDPQGTLLAVLQPPATASAPDPGLDDAGRVGWHELNTHDAAAAWDFHAPLFGWRLDARHDMGGNGSYWLFAERAGDRNIGGIAAGPNVTPGWAYYFNVAAIDAALACVADGGGTVRYGPYQVPGGSWTAGCTDPYGAAFTLSAPER